MCAHSLTSLLFFHATVPPWSVEDHLSAGYTAMDAAMIKDPDTYYVDSFETVLASEDNLEVAEKRGLRAVKA